MERIEYRCPPCGCNQDTLRFSNVGSCPTCKMPLVQVPQGAALMADQRLAPFLEAGMLGQLYTKIIYPVFAVGILLSLFLLFKSTRGKSLNVFLSGIILVLSLYGFKNQLFGVNYGLTSTYKSLFTPISFILLLGPLAYLYVKSLVANPFKWRPRYGLHFLPAGVMFLYYALLFVMPEHTKQQFMATPFEVRFGHMEQIQSIFIGMAYLFFAHRLFAQWKIAHPIRNVTFTAWVFRFLVGMAGLFLFWGFMVLANFALYDFGVTTLSYNPLWLFIAVVLIWLGTEVVSNLKFFLLNKSINVSNGKQGVDEAGLSSLKDKLNLLMVDQKLYLDPNLSLDILASALDVNPKYLSALLNNSLKKNFYDFVNQYRVDEVKKRLGDEHNRYLTIEAIANQAGFRSKSSFNAAFRKQMNMTPREFIKQEVRA